MALIKQAHSDRITRHAVVVEMGDLDQQARQIIEHAKAEAKRLLDQARTEAQRIRSQAQEAGHAEGDRRGYEEGVQRGIAEGRDTALNERRTQLDELLARWNAAAMHWEDARHSLLQAAQEDVIRFALAVAEKITRRVLKADTTIARDQLYEAVVLLGKPTSIEIVLHPQDRALIDAELPNLLTRLRSCQHVAVREDETITPGGIMINTPGGRVDATIETQLDRIAEAIAPAPHTT